MSGALPAAGFEAGLSSLDFFVADFIKTILSGPAGFA